MLIRRRTKIFALFVSLGLTASACGKSSAPSSNSADNTSGSAAATTEKSAAPAGGEKVLRDGYVLGIGNPPHFDPALNFTVEGAQIITQIWDSMTEFDFSDPKNPVLKPQVAESWTANADASEFVFKVRAGMVFSNGNPVLPSSFAFAWNRAADKTLAATYAYLFYFIKGGKDVVEGKAKTIAGVVADDKALTLTVTLDKPYADFPAVLSHNVFWPLDEPTVKAVKDQSAYERGVMIGNGPFKMVGPYVKDKGVSLVPNEKYAGTVVGATDGKLNLVKPKLTRIDFVASKDLDTSYQTFEAGQIDTAGFPSGKYKEAIAKYPNYVASSFNLDYYVFRYDDPVVGGPKNEKLRQAISMAIDRQARADAVCEGSCVVADSLVPPGIPGHLDGLCTICKHDVAKAKALMAEWKAAGGTLSGPITLAFNAGAGHEDTINIIQANLAEIGVEIKQKPISSETYFQDMGKDPAQFFRLGWGADYPLYDNFTGDLLATGSSNNYSKYSDPAFDAGLDKARSLTDPVARAAAYQEIEKLAVNQGYALPLSWGNGGLVFTKKVQGLVRYPSLMVNYDFVDIG
jgi:oligopeptide transport system substrate-binding protein